MLIAQGDWRYQPRREQDVAVVILPVVVDFVPPVPVGEEGASGFRGIRPVASPRH